MSSTHRLGEAEDMQRLEGSVEHKLGKRYVITLDDRGGSGRNSTSVLQGATAPMNDRLFQNLTRT